MNWDWKQQPGIDEKNDRHSGSVVVRGLMGRAGICRVVERKLVPSLKTVKVC